MMYRKLCLLLMVFALSSCSLDAVESTNLTAKGMQFYAQGMMSKAEDAFKMAIEKDAKNDQAQYRLGIMRTQARDYSEAARYFKRSVELKPDEAQYHYMLASVLLSQGESLRDEADAALAKSLLDDAAKSFVRTIELDPYYAEAHLKLARVYRAGMDLQKAAVAYEQSIHANPKLMTDDAAPTAVAYKELGMLYADYGFNIEAARVLLNGVQNNPMDAQLETELANIYLELRQYTDALLHFKKAFDLFQSHNADRLDLVLPTVYGVGISNYWKAKEAQHNSKTAEAIDLYKEAKTWLDKFALNAAAPEMMGQRAAAQGYVAEIREVLMTLEGKK
ncbi:MAG: tetratricopeptide repeat protein [Bradymonadia bacterium]